MELEHSKAEEAKYLNECYIIMCLEKLAPLNQKGYSVNPVANDHNYHIWWVMDRKYSYNVSW